MSTPDTFAGGQFDLPLKVAKLVRLADSTDAVGEHDLIIQKLWGLGYFLDKAGVIWDRDAVPSYVRSHDPWFKRLKDNNKSRV